MKQEAAQADKGKEQKLAAKVQEVVVEGKLDEVIYEAELAEADEAHGTVHSTYRRAMRRNGGTIMNNPRQRSLARVTAVLLGFALAMSGVLCVPQIAFAKDSSSQVAIAEDPAESAEVEVDDTSDEQIGEGGVEPEGVDGVLANSWRFTDGIYTGATTPAGKSALASKSSSFVTWKKNSKGTITFSNGIKTTGAIAIGIDVSEWQEDIDWAKVKAQGVDFAIIRCGYGSNKSKWDDKYFLQNVRGCLNNDIPFGIYLYSYAESLADAKSEAAHALRLLKEAGLDPEDLDYPVYYDLEDRCILDATSSNAQILNFAKAFCNAIEDEGYKVGVYANLNWWETYLTSSTYNKWERWVAQYNTICDYDGEYLMWQCTSSGKVNGISGAVDMNLQYPKQDIGKLVTDSKGVRFLRNNGTYATSEWVRYQGKRYYFGADGYALTSQVAQIGSYYYNFAADGTLRTGWYTWGDGSRSYFSSNFHDGAAVKGRWWTISGERRYFDGNGRLVQ